MNVERVLTEFRRELRELEREGETLERTPQVTRRTGAGGAFHNVVAFDLDESTIDAAVQEEAERARTLGDDVEWKVFSFDPPSLVDRLRRAGFEVGPRESIVAYDLADGLGPFEESPVGEVRRVDRVADLDDYRRAAEGAFGRDVSGTVAMLADALRSGREGQRAYVAYADGEPASAGRLDTDPRSGFAGLYGGGTRPEFRGRGLYRSVVAARARDAAAFGARFLTVDALPTSLPILLRLGFVRLADTWPCVVGPSVNLQTP